MAKFQGITYRGHNGYDTKAASDEATIPAENYGESLTIQAHAEDADINVMMKRYGITGKMPENPHIPTYGDFTNVKDYRSAVEAVRNAHEGFMEIPAELRARFDNDVQRFMEFCTRTDQAAIDDFKRFGLHKLVPPAPELSHDTKAIVEAVKGSQKTEPAPKPPNPST